MKLIYGLGNPGDKFIDTRHNMGYEAVDMFADGLMDGYAGSTQLEIIDMADYSFVQFDDLILAMNCTFINEAGVGLRQLMKGFKIEITDLLVVHDEMDFDPGDARIKYGATTDRHNGLKSIVGALETSEFTRIRIGIGRPDDNSKVLEHVLGKPDSNEAKELEFGLQRANILMAEWLNVPST